MDKLNLAVSSLAGLGLVGVFVLLGLDKNIDKVLPVVSLLVGAVVGLNRDSILGVFKKK